MEHALWLRSERAEEDGKKGEKNKSGGEGKERRPYETKACEVGRRVQIGRRRDR